MNSTSTILADRFWPQTGSLISTRNIVLAVVGSLIVAASAQISVPMLPVPTTLQTLAVLGIGAAYGSRLGAATLALYAIEGSVGLPFFAHGQAGLINPQGLILSTIGFIVGFILAAWLVGKLIESGWGQTMSKTILATLIGAAVLYVPGLIWLAGWAAQTQHMTIAQAVPAAFSWGLFPFILGDIVKAIIAALGFQAAWGLAKR